MDQCKECWNSTPFTSRQSTQRERAHDPALKIYSVKESRTKRTLSVAMILTAFIYLHPHVWLIFYWSVNIFSNSTLFLDSHIFANLLTSLSFAHTKTLVLVFFDDTVRTRMKTQTFKVALANFFGQKLQRKVVVENVLFRQQAETEQRQCNRLWTMCDSTRHK